MKISVFGLNHKTSSVALRERFSVQADRIPSLLEKYRPIVPECLVISTCNRFEVLYREQEEGVDQLLDVTAAEFQVPREMFESSLYCFSDEEAIRHIFRVAASLDSLVVGEAQILGQVKDFFSGAQKAGTIGVALHALIERAFTVAKKVRTETRIAEQAVSISSVAVDLALKIFGDIGGKTVLVIGAGKMSVLALRHLRAHGVRKILITNRTFTKACELAQQVEGVAFPISELAVYLKESDILISSTGCPHFVLEKEEIRRAMETRKSKPMFLIDIAVPRDLDPRIHEIPNAYLYNLDDLKNVADNNRVEREKEAQKAELIALQESRAFWKRLRELDVNPTIREIQARVEEVRRRELEAALRKLGPITQEQKLGIETLVSRLAEKLLQRPFSELRHAAAEGENQEKIAFIRKLFGLTETPHGFVTAQKS